MLRMFLVTRRKNNYFRVFSKMFCSSYIIHEIAVIVLLLCLDFSFAQQVADPQIVSTLKSVSGLQESIESTKSSDEDLPKVLRGGELFPEQKRGLFFGEDANGVPIVSGTWFRYGSYTLAFAMYATSFLIACAASAVYYVLFVVTEPSQQRSSTNYEETWNVGRVLRALQLAYETYETFDPYSPACQLKTICEVQESGHFQGSLVKRITHFMIHTDLVRQKVANAADLQAADRIGNSPEEQCSERFPECKFSLNKLYESYLTL